MTSFKIECIKWFECSQCFVCFGCSECFVCFGCFECFKVRVGFIILYRCVVMVRTTWEYILTWCYMWTCCFIDDKNWNIELIIVTLFVEFVSIKVNGVGIVVNFAINIVNCLSLIVLETINIVSLLWNNKEELFWSFGRFSLGFFP